jgi:septal ring factor EnvC (AmiA/AmiB activator)
MAFPTKDEMRARFWELKGAIDSAEEAVAPLREARDAAWNAAQEADRAALAEIRAIEDAVDNGEGMFKAKNEMALIARALGGTVGEPI